MEKEIIRILGCDPRLVALIMSMMVSIPSCSPRIVERVNTEYQVVTEYQHDTLWRDREKVIKEKGDTVTVYEKEYIYRTLWRDRTDTLLVHDTTAVETIKEVKVEKSLTWWQRLRMGAFWWILGALILTNIKRILKWLSIP